MINSIRVTQTVESADEMVRVPDGEAILVCEGGFNRWVSFACPCGHGHRITIPVDTRNSSAWALVSVDPLTIRPSIDSNHWKNDGHCHFFVTDGKVLWCGPIPHNRRMSL